MGGHDAGAPWHKAHRKVELDLLRSLGPDGGLVLKGGTALMLCYGLDRFSEDLDFDAASPGVSTIDKVRRFCDEAGYEAFVKKDTPTVQRLTVHYGGERPLKVETSYRRACVAPEETAVVDGILTYKLPALATMKLHAYAMRDRVRDLYDVSFIVNEKWGELTEDVRSAYRYALAVKGLEQFDLVLAQEPDDLVDQDALVERFLAAHGKLGLLGEEGPAVSQGASLAEEGAAELAAARQLGCRGDGRHRSAPAR